MALIAAAAIAIAAGAYYGYRYYRKRKLAKEQDTPQVQASDRHRTAADSNAQQTEAAARLAQARQMQKRVQATRHAYRATFMAYAALLLGSGVAGE